MLDASVETLTARKDDIAGFAVASDERIEAYLLYVTGGADPPGHAAEIVSLRTFLDDGGAHLRRLIARVRAQGFGSCRIPKVHPAEGVSELLATLGFRPSGGHLRRRRARAIRVVDGRP